MLQLSSETAVAATIDLLKTVGCTGELDCGCRLCCARYQAEYERTPDVLRRAVDNEKKLKGAPIERR